MTENDSESTPEEEDGEVPPEATEQYTMYVETTLDVSNRRLRNNRFYVLLLSGTLAVISVLAKTDIIQAAGLVLAGATGFALCILWYASILSYQQLNSGKYEVVTEMEEELPFAPFSREWDVLKQGEDWRTYLTHTRVEKKIPLVLAAPYVVVTVYGLLQLLQ